MVTTRVQVEGLTPLVRRLKALDAELPKEVRRLNRSAAESVIPLATSLAPWDEGTLAGSIRVGATQRSAYLAAGKASIPYAPPIHFGWPARGIEAQPFLWEAAEQAQPEVVADYFQGLSDLMARVGL